VVTNRAALNPTSRPSDSSTYQPHELEHELSRVSVLPILHKNDIYYGIELFGELRNTYKTPSGR
jgi:hypothetical protein